MDEFGEGVGNPFDTPVPGQSLTDEPGNYPWEHAPKNVDPEIILERTWRGMENILRGNRPCRSRATSRGSICTRTSQK